MRFSHPWWLAVALLACALCVGMWRRHDARQRAALARFVAAHLRSELTQSISTAKRRVQRGLFLAAAVLLCAALAGPQLGYRWEQISRRGNEIVFAIDTSRSMLTPDIKPNRLARAKLAIDDFANQLDGDAVGIVAFAGSAFLVCPLTLDYGAFHESLSAVDTNTIPRGGTNIASAIREAQAALRRRPGSDRILILVTDGEDLEGSALAAARSAKQQDGLTIFTVGVGTAGGDLIPIPAEQGGGFVKDETGQFVKSRLDEPALKAIAQATGGFYAPLGTQGEGLESIYKTALGPLAKHDLASRQQRVYTERYQWPLAVSLGSLLLSLGVGTRRRAPARSAVPASAARVRVAALAVLMALIGAAPQPTRAAAPNPEDAYAKGDFGAAERAYAAAAQRDPAKPLLEYNLGTAAYRAGQFPQAAQAFQQSITKAPSSDPKRLADQEDAYYNLGNALFRAGQKTEQASPQETLQKWNDAVKAYETALQLRANDADSKYNRDLVKRKIDALKQNQNQNQNKNQNKNQGQNPNQNPQPNQSQNPPDKGSGQPPNQPQGQPPNQPPNQSPNQPPNQPQSQPPSQPQGSPQNANNNGQQQSQPPPQNPGGPQGQPPPQNPGPQPPAGNGQPPRQDQAGADPDKSAGDDASAADDQPPPGQMNREEARELLDSVKDDERRAPLTPLARRDSYDEPQQPVKNW
ncbi:MAG: VWA domain-containing protein [Steroidobacteraceae bacterium]